MTEQLVPERALLRALPRVLAVVLLTGACATGPAPADRSTGSAPAAAAQPPTSLVEPTASAGDGSDDGGSDDVPHTPAVPVDPTAAGPVAVALVAAYARPDLDADAWLSGVVPLLSPTAADAVQGTDPALVPAAAVTGEPVELPSASALLALLDVPTDAGPCRVLLSWDDGVGTWVGERVSWTAAP